MIEALDIRGKSIARAVLALQRRSYAVEARLVGSRDIPPLHETLEELRECGECFHGYFVGETLAGAISTKCEANILDIHRLVVAPEYFRRGIASSMLRFIEADGAWEKITVGTGAGNEPAKRLYISHGFVEAGEREVAPGLSWVRFEKASGV